jgi:DNA-binding NarL/FixJ family response regulator
MKPLQIVLIEEHAAVRWALETRLASSSMVAGIDAFIDVPSALQAISDGKVKPDMILLGLNSGRANTMRQKLEAVVRLAAKNAPVLVLVPYVDDLERELLLRVGASRYSLKNINTPQLLNEIEQTAHQTTNTSPVRLSNVQLALSGLT